MTVAALFVDPRGAYANLPGVELWDATRDARGYQGPHPVIAHPPCSTWCQLASVNEARYGHAIGSDGGCFEAALAAVRRFGGVLEHPAYSLAWARYGLGRPPESGGWVSADFEGGWSAYVEQGRYGHPARKATWLYAVGVELPSLRWGQGYTGEALVSWADKANYPDRPRVGKALAAATPEAFRDVLLGMVRR